MYRQPALPAPPAPPGLHSPLFGYILCCLVRKSHRLLRPRGLQPTRLLCPWGFPGEECWGGLSFPSPGALPNPGTESTSPALAGRVLPPSCRGSPGCVVLRLLISNQVVSGPATSSAAVSVLGCFRKVVTSGTQIRFPGWGAPGPTGSPAWQQSAGLPVSLEPHHHDVWPIFFIFASLLGEKQYPSVILIVFLIKEFDLIFLCLRTFLFPFCKLSCLFTSLTLVFWQDGLCLLIIKIP